MKFQKSIIATAILLASANFAVAADLSWKDSTDFDFEAQYKHEGSTDQGHSERNLFQNVTAR